MSELDDLEKTLYPEGYQPLDPSKLSAIVKHRRGIYLRHSESSLRDLRRASADRRLVRNQPSLPKFKCLID